ncbi:MAG: hypothetical protein ACIWVG_15665, partial [Gloeotrichia echinulata HAB0833]
FLVSPFKESPRLKAGECQLSHRMLFQGLGIGGEVSASEHETWTSEQETSHSPVLSPQSPIPNPQSPVPNPQSPIPNPQSPLSNIIPVKVWRL